MNVSVVFHYASCFHVQVIPSPTAVLLVSVKIKHVYFVLITAVGILLCTAQIHSKLQALDLQFNYGRDKIN